MNPIQKVYCRVFQTALRIALPVLPYREPVILHSVQEVPDIILKNGKKRVLLVTDATVRRLGLTKGLEEALAAREIPCCVYSGTVANPTTENVEEALKLYRRGHCDALIGFGGGSSMDCAKAVGACIARPGRKPGDMEGILKVRRPLPLLIAVPTTAGTGSEATLAAVIVDSATRHKYAINDFPLIPRYAVLDPEVTLSLPPFVTATTGLDALAHAVEAYIGNSTTKETRRDARKAVSLIFQNLNDACRNGQDIRARENMLMAAFFAGCAFTRSYVGYVHAVAHSLGGAYDVPHGLANAMLLPRVLRAYGSRIDSKLKDLAVAAGVAWEDTPQKEAAARFLDAIEDLNQSFDIPDRLPALKKKDIPKLARQAAHEANPLYPVPVLMDAKQLEVFYEMLLVQDGGKAKGKREA